MQTNNQTGPCSRPSQTARMLHYSAHCYTTAHWLIKALQTHRQTQPVSGVDGHPCGVPSCAPRPCTITTTTKPLLSLVACPPPPRPCTTTTKPLLSACTPKPLSSVALPTLALRGTLSNPEAATSLCGLTNVPNGHTAVSGRHVRSFSSRCLLQQAKPLAHQ